MKAVFVLGMMAVGVAAFAQPPQPQKAPPPTIADVLASSPKADWRRLDPNRLLLMDLPSGRVTIELAPAFAPNHVENLRTLVRERYFEGLAVIRVQDNFVAQWGDPEEGEVKAKSLGTAKPALKAEFTRKGLDGVAWSRHPDRDAYADEVGFANGMPAGRDAKTGEAWLLHCYGTVAVARDNSQDSGSGVALYAVIGQARQLERNLTVVGRVVDGIERLSSLPRGTAALGFYADPKQRTPIIRMRFASETSDYKPLEALKTDTATFTRVTEMRRNRRDDFYQTPAGHIEVCATPLAVRPVTP